MRGTGVAAVDDLSSQHHKLSDVEDVCKEKQKD